MNDVNPVMSDIVLSFQLSLCDGTQFTLELTREKQPPAQAVSVVLMGISGLSSPSTFSAA